MNNQKKVIAKRNREIEKVLKKNFYFSNWGSNDVKILANLIRMIEKEEVKKSHNEGVEFGKKQEIMERDSKIPDFVFNPKGIQIVKIGKLRLGATSTMSRDNFITLLKSAYRKSEMITFKIPKKYLGKELKQ